MNKSLTKKGKSDIFYTPRSLSKAAIVKVDYVGVIDECWVCGEEECQTEYTIYYKGNATGQQEFLLDCLPERDPELLQFITRGNDE